MLETAREILLSEHLRDKFGANQVLSMEIGETMMKKLCLSLILVSFLSVVAQAQEARIYVVKDGQPVATIVKPKDAPQWTSQAGRGG